MTQEDWLARWREGRIGFHEGKPNAFLSKYAERLLPEGPGRVLVPLCGKTRDMAYLASLGHEVVGVELSLLAARAFFEESGLEPKSSRRGPFEAFEGNGVEILVGDYFALEPRLLGPVGAAFDRAALVAMPPEKQPAYAGHLLSLLPRGGRVLLVTFDYDQAKMEGPPFSVPEAQVLALFGERCRVERLETLEYDEQRPRFRDAGVDRVREEAWLLTLA